MFSTCPQVQFCAAVIPHTARISESKNPSERQRAMKRSGSSVCLANSYYVYKSPLFHRLVNPGGNGTIWVHA